MSPLGPALGVLNGLIIGIVLILYIRTAALGRRSLRTTLTLAAHLLAIPAFGLGGPWLASAMLRSVDWTANRDGYVVALVVTALLIAGYPLLMFIIATGNRLSREAARR